MIRWKAPNRRHRNVPKRNRDGLITCLILAFVERQELAKSSRQRPPPITTGLHPTTVMDLPMSVFRVITSGVGGKAAVVGDRRLRPLLTQ
jgi:hypothetical protein